jgi:hypothetical protein
MREATYVDGQHNSLMKELAAPNHDGSIPLLNFLENTTKFVHNTQPLHHRISYLEKEHKQYKKLQKKYSRVVQYLEQLTNKINCCGVNDESPLDLFQEEEEEEEEPAHFASNTVGEYNNNHLVEGLHKTRAALTGTNLRKSGKNRSLLLTHLREADDSSQMSETNSQVSDFSLKSYSRGAKLRKIYESNIQLNKQMAEEMKELEALRKSLLEDEA